MKTVILALLAILAALAYRYYAMPAVEKTPMTVEAAVTPTSGIHLISASYGPNCGAPPGNVTNAVGAVCDGKDDCSYKVEVGKLGDPAPKCSKSFVVEYECMPRKTQLRREIPGEAGLGSEALLSCRQPMSTDLPSSIAAQAPQPVPATPPPPATVEAAANPVPTAPAEAGISVSLATYGLNCGGALGNATRDLSEACNGKDHCDYEIQVARFGDPKPRCGKNFIAHYACAPGRTGFMQTIPGEAGLGKHLLISCPVRPAGALALPAGIVVEPPSKGIDIKLATYGANCGGKPGNATFDLGDTCNGKDICDYVVDVARFGDPKQGCAKDFAVRYVCAPGHAAVTRKLPGEAGLGSHLLLDCGAPDR